MRSINSSFSTAGISVQTCAFSGANVRTTNPISFTKCWLLGPVGLPSSGVSVTPNLAPADLNARSAAKPLVLPRTFLTEAKMI